MQVEIVTKQDIENLFEQLKEIKSLLENRQPEQKQYLRSKDLRRVLGASPNTIAKLRYQGYLTPKKVGGLLYYDAGEVGKLLKK